MASCGTKDGFTLFGEKVITEVELLPASIFTDSAIDFVKLMTNAMAVFRCVSKSIFNHPVRRKLMKLLLTKLDRS